MDNIIENDNNNINIAIIYYKLKFVLTVNDYYGIIRMKYLILYFRMRRVGCVMMTKISMVKLAPDFGSKKKKITPQSACYQDFAGFKFCQSL
jgi:hypothetical protein